MGVLPSFNRPAGTRRVRQFRLGAVWLRHCDELAEFHRQHGHFNVPPTGATAGLYDWAGHQRNQHHCGQLGPDQVQRLEAIGFPWINPDSGAERAWSRNFDRLLESHRANGHFFVSGQAGPAESLRGWMLTQRLLHKFGRLRPDRQQRLEAAGFPWNPPLYWQPAWERHFAELMEHYRRHGHFLVSRLEPAGVALRDWMQSQRRNRRTGRLRLEQQQRLEAAGFPWVAAPELKLPTAAWERHFAELLAYRERFGHCAVPVQWAENPTLGHWVASQRSRRKRGTISPESFRRLEEVNFVWVAKDRPRIPTAAWERRFAELLAYRERFGHCAVPVQWAENPALGRWVADNRRRRKGGTISPESFRRLEEVNFVWVAKDGPQMPTAAWERHFAELLAYRERFGHYFVPVQWAENPALGRWVAGQRRWRKRGTISPESFRRLEEISFVWAAKDGLRVPTAAWERRFAELLAYRERFGHCAVPGQWAENRALGRWVEGQRYKRRRGKLLSEERRRLEAVSFAWAAKPRTGQPVPLAWEG